MAQNNFNATDNLMFTWRHNSTTIQDNYNRRMITYFPENSYWVARSMLVVMNVTRRDGGQYQCVASNREIVDDNSDTALVTVYCKCSVLFTVVTGNGNACTLLDKDILKPIVRTIFEYT